MQEGDIEGYPIPGQYWNNTSQIPGQYWANTGNTARKIGNYRDTETKIHEITAIIISHAYLKLHPACVFIYLNGRTSLLTENFQYSIVTVVH